jgi:hypothetical protein
MSVRQGENPQYDAAMERQLLSARLRYASVEAAVAMEAKKAELRLLLDQAVAVEQTARLNLLDAQTGVKRAKQELARVDADFRAQRREENTRLQREAEAVGAKTYATNTPCRNGHHSPRYTSSGACVMCDRIGWEGGRLKTSERQSQAEQ